MSDGSAHAAGQLAGTVLAAVLIYGGIVLIGFLVGKKLAKSRDDVEFVKWPLQVAFGLVILLLIGQCSGQSRAEAAENFNLKVSI